MGNQVKGKEKQKLNQSSQVTTNKNKEQSKHIKSDTVNKKNQKQSQQKSNSNYPKYIQEFQKQLEVFNLEIEECDPDGNCLFRAFSIQIDNDQDGHDYYRHLACDYITKNENEFINFIPDQNLKKYVAKLSQAETWGGDIEIIALSKVLNVNVIVFQKDRGPYVFTSSKNEIAESQIILLAFHKQYNHYSSVISSIDPASNTKARDYIIQLCQHQQLSLSQETTSNTGTLETGIESFK